MPIRYSNEKLVDFNRKYQEPQPAADRDPHGWLLRSPTSREQNLWLVAILVLVLISIASPLLKLFGAAS